MTLPAKSIPETVAHLDIEIIAAALIRNDASIRNAARELNVPSADLRKLMLLDQRLADASTEAVELQLDECEANLREGLRSDDPKRRDAISMFFLRNVQRAAKRGYATAASAASLEVSLGEREPQNIVISWLGERETETIERDGQTFEVPRYGDGRSDGYLEGELVTPRTLIEHGVDHCVDHCVDHQVEPTIVEPAEPASAEPAESAALRVERARIDAWIAQRVIPWAPNSCLRCRRPIAVGAEFVDVVGGDGRARLHAVCHVEWQAEARRALGLG